MQLANAHFDPAKNLPAVYLAQYRREGILFCAVCGSSLNRKEAAEKASSTTELNSEYKI